MHNATVRGGLVRQHYWASEPARSRWITLKHQHISSLHGSAGGKKKNQDDSCSLALQEDVLVLRNSARVEVSHRHVVLDPGCTRLHLERVLFYFLKFGHLHNKIDLLLSVTDVKESKHILL